MFGSNLKGLELANRSSQQDWHVAISCFTKAIYLVDIEPSYFLHRGNVHLRLGDFHSAISNFSVSFDLTATTPPSKSIFLQNRLGMAKLCFSQCLIDDEEYESALRLLDESLALGVDNFYIRLYRYSNCFIR